RHDPVIRTAAGRRQRTLRNGSEQPLTERPGDWCLCGDLAASSPHRGVVRAGSAPIGNRQAWALPTSPSAVGAWAILSQTGSGKALFDRYAAAIWASAQLV